MNPIIHVKWFVVSLLRGWTLPVTHVRVTRCAHRSPMDLITKPTPSERIYKLPVFFPRPKLRTNRSEVVLARFMKLQISDNSVIRGVESSTNILVHPKRRSLVESRNTATTSLPPPERLCWYWTVRGSGVLRQQTVLSLTTWNTSVFLWEMCVKSKQW